MRTCPVCRTDFEPTHSSQRFCPPPEGKRKSKCAKAYENAKRRGTLDALLQRGGVALPFDCEWCGKPCIPGSDVPAHASRFCSVEHKRAWHRREVERPRLLIEALTAEMPCAAIPASIAATQRSSWTTSFPSLTGARTIGPIERAPARAATSRSRTCRCCSGWAGS